MCSCSAVDGSYDDGEDGGNAGNDLEGRVAEVLLTLANLLIHEVHGHVEIREPGLTQQLRIHLLQLLGAPALLLPVPMRDPLAEVVALGADLHLRGVGVRLLLHALQARHGGGQAGQAHHHGYNTLHHYSGASSQILQLKLINHK